MTGIGLIVAIAIPVVVFFGGARIMKLVSGTASVLLLGRALRRKSNLH